MTAIPTGTKFVGISSTVPTPENKSSQNNALQEVYTMQDIIDTVSADIVTTTKYYKALILQTGTNAPTVTVLENTLGGTVVWARTSAGVYTATLASVFTANKTICNGTASFLGDAQEIKPLSTGTEITGYYQFNSYDTSFCELTTQGVDVNQNPSGTGSDLGGIMGISPLYVEISVYS